MKLRYFVILILLCLNATLIAVEKKPSITSELLELRGELMQAGERIVQLKKDKAAIDESFKALEDWAVLQQKEKIELYEESERCRVLLSNAEQKVVTEKVEHNKTRNKYDRIKSFMGYLAGAFLGLLYLRVGSTVVGSLISTAGPWGFILQFLGPFGAFALGYFLVQSYF